jgi:gamma-glutamyltranspeptidase/glutathione hydrolase
MVWAGAKAEGSHGAVAAASPLAAQVALEVLKQGGNAVDAAVAAGFTLSVTEPHASGVGGGGGLLYYHAATRSAHYLDFYVRAGQEPPSDFSTRDAHSGRAVCVPGLVAGLCQALQQHGTWSLHRVLSLVIAHLEQGFVFDEALHNSVVDNLDLVARDERLAALFLEEGFPKEVGARIHNPAHVALYRQLAAHGPDAFYRGAVADSIVAVVRRHGGTLTREDFASYTPVIRPPVQAEYRGFQIVSAPPPQGGTALLEVLNIIENLPLQAMGHYTRSWRVAHFFIEALRRADADRRAFVGDPDFVPVPSELLVSQGYANERFADIRATRLWPVPAGSPQRSLQRLPAQREDGHTSHISVVDAAGNAVSMTQTLNLFWGSGLVVEGFLLNNGMTGFSTREGVNTPGPGRRPRSTIAPTIVLKEGRVYLVVGSPGAGRITSTLAEVVSSVLDYSIWPDSANAAPRLAASVAGETVEVEARFSPEVMDSLRVAGHAVAALGEFDPYFGGVQMILYDHERGRYIASSDPRRSGAALAF